MNPSDFPLVTLLFICYNQQESVGPALAGALAQDYPNLEIVISDDASQDATYACIEAMLEGYAGPHRIKLLRNAQNLGIGGNIDHAVRQSSGELIFIGAGDDISLPERVSATVRFWREQDCKPDLIAAYLNDIDSAGNFHGVLRITDLAAYRSLEDWTRSPPHVIGAAQAWTRRLFDRFGGLPKGVVGEDMVMAFRAIATGSAVTLPVPLVNYRRGGLTSKRKSLCAADVIRGLKRKLNSSQIELRSMLADARKLGASPTTLAFLEQKLDKEIFVEKMFAAKSWQEKLRICGQHPGQPLDFRTRIFTYAAVPWLLAPFFALKRWRYRNR
ncbi:MAG: glycosyltransferase family 2 protein [Betaproteobacteria bacterium]